MDIFSALAEPTRRNIVELLATSGQMSVSDICDKFPISHPAISQHLKVLRDTDVVSVEKRAQQRLYAINPLAVDELEVWITNIRKQWSDRLDRLDTLLQKEKHKQHLHK